MFLATMALPKVNTGRPPAELGPPPGILNLESSHGAFAFGVRFPALTKEWLETSNYLIVVTVADEDELAALLTKAGHADLHRVPVREPDLGGALTCVVLEPGDIAKRLCANLPLALKEVALA